MALLSTLVDSFTTEIDTSKWSLGAGSGSVSLVDGVLTQTGSKSITSVDTYDFDIASVRADNFTPTLSWGWWYFSVGQEETTERPYPENRLMSIGLGSGTLSANWQGYDLDPTFATSEPPTTSWEGYGGYFDIDYDPVEMRYLKMTNTVESGVLTATFETSPDGSTWTTFYSFTCGPDDVPYSCWFSGADMSIELADFNTTLSSGSDPVIEVFDSGSSSPYYPVPKISTLIDSFSASSVNPQWDLISEPSISTSQLKLDMEEGVRSGKLYDLTSSQAFLTVIRSGIESSFIFKYEVDDNNSVYFEISDAYIYFALVKDSVTDETYTIYDGDNHKHLQLRERYGTLYFDTSPDGDNWTIQRQVVHEMDLTSGNLVLFNGNLSDLGLFGAGLFGDGLFGEGGV